MSIRIQQVWRISNLIRENVDLEKFIKLLVGRGGVRMSIYTRYGIRLYSASWWWQGKKNALVFRAYGAIDTLNAQIWIDDCGLRERRFIIYRQSPSSTMDFWLWERFATLRKNVRLQVEGKLIQMAWREDWFILGKLPKINRYFAGRNCCSLGILHLCRCFTHLTERNAVEFIRASGGCKHGRRWNFEQVYLITFCIGSLRLICQAGQSEIFMKIVSLCLIEKWFRKRAIWMKRRIWEWKEAESEREE